GDLAGAAGHHRPDPEAEPDPDEPADGGAPDRVLAPPPGHVALESDVRGARLERLDGECDAGRPGHVVAAGGAAEDADDLRDRVLGRRVPAAALLAPERPQVLARRQVLLEAVEDELRVARDD